MTRVKAGILTAFAAVILLGTSPRARAQLPGAGNVPHPGMPAAHGADGQSFGRVYIRSYPYWARYPYAGLGAGSSGTGFSQGYDYYGYLPANPPFYPRLIVIPPPPPPPPPPPLMPRRNDQPGGWAARP